MLAYLAVVATVLMPGGLWVNCLAADGHTMIEVAHPEHNGIERHTEAHEQLGDPGCEDTALDWVAEALIRDRIDLIGPSSSEPIPQVLFVLDDIELRTDLCLSSLPAVPVPGTRYSLALRSIVLLV
ncbi:MAG: hypothetical protein RLN76_04420 [Phycisphaeraceae bacterium]